ncbi:MAG: DUF4357 domain-containing protein [Victivallaceae bacterium]|nr:DUF4357 domain-containing protein [Victivallaceae bacterium]
MKQKTDHFFLTNLKGKKVAVLLKIKEFERLMHRLATLEKQLKEKTGGESLEEKLGFTEDGKMIKSSNIFTKSPIHKPVLFEMHDEFCSAQGILLPDGKCFKVLTGSKASGIIDRKLSANIRHLREELIMLEVLVKDTVHGDLIFTRDYEFDNPSDAASTIAASPREGSLCWMAVENGKAMRQY